jgi:hypothetical protein
MQPTSLPLTTACTQPLYASSLPSPPACQAALDKARRDANAARASARSSADKAREVRAQLDQALAEHAKEVQQLQVSARCQQLAWAAVACVRGHVPLVGCSHGNWQVQVHDLASNN